MGHYDWGGWPPYVPVAERRKKAEKKIKQLRKKGRILEPISIEGRTITKTYWGKSWCSNLESYSDLDNRLPRGRSYVRNGAVIDLKIAAGSVKALVHGSELYEVTLDIAALTKDKWQTIIKECSGKIDSLVELLKGKFSKSVMEIIARKEQGLFPHPKEIKINCSCPDYAGVCKHVAAVFYGIGARLDESPELLFILRQVDHADLIVTDSVLETLVKRDSKQLESTFTGSELSDIFGIDIDMGAAKVDGDMKKPLHSRKTSKMVETTKKTRIKKSKKVQVTKEIKKPEKIEKRKEGV